MWGDFRFPRRLQTETFYGKYWYADYRVPPPPLSAKNLGSLINKCPDSITVLTKPDSA